MAFFTNASSTKLVATNPGVTGLPFTVGLWVMPTTSNTSNKIVWGIGVTATSFTDFVIYQGQNATFPNNSNWNLEAGNSAAFPTVTNVGTLATNAWQFIIGRVISTTNRRLSVLNSDNTTAHGQNTTSITVAACDRMSIGVGAANGQSVGFFDGHIAEMWYTNNDIQADGGQLSDSMLRQLAYYGPFSIPAVANKLVEYRSLRRLDSFQDTIGEQYFNNNTKSAPNWVSTNTPIISLSPPLPPGYLRPKPPFNFPTLPQAQGASTFKHKRILLLNRR